jgi:hypothetical protein
LTFSSWFRPKQSFWNFEGCETIMRLAGVEL